MRNDQSDPQQNPSPPPSPPPERDSISSIPSGLRALYFALFTVYATVGIAIQLWHNIATYPPEKWREAAMAITEGIGAATVGAAGLALLTIEGPESVMIIADYIRKRWVKPLEEKQRAEAAQKRADAEEQLATAQQRQAEAQQRQAEAEEHLAEAEKLRAEAARINAETEEILAKQREDGLQEGRQEGLQEGRQEGLQEGQSQTQAQWQAWNQRRLDAEANNQPFNEPPPASP